MTYRKNGYHYVCELPEGTHKRDSFYWIDRKSGQCRCLLCGFQFNMNSTPTPVAGIAPEPETLTKGELLRTARNLMRDVVWNCNQRFRKTGCNGGSWRLCEKHFPQAERLGLAPRKKL